MSNVQQCGVLSRSRKKDQTLVLVESVVVETGRARDVVKKMLSRKVHGMVRGEHNTGSSESAREAARVCPGYGKGATIDMRRTVQWSL